MRIASHRQSVARHLTSAALSLALITSITISIVSCSGGVKEWGSKPSGIDLSSMDKQVRPQDNFFSYVNGNWVKNTPIPGDQTRWGVFNILREKSQKDAATIINELADEPANPDEKKIADLYNSFMNEAAIEAAGLKPLEAEFAAIEKINSYRGVYEHFAKAFRGGYDSPFSPYVDADSKNPTQNILQFYQSGIGLGLRDYYLDTSDKGISILDKYRLYVADLLVQSGDKKAAAHTQAIFELESALANIHWAKEDNRDADKTYNKMTLTELRELMPAFPWSTYFKQLGISDQAEVIVSQPSYFKALPALVTKYNLETWKAYFRFHLVDSYSPYLKKSIADSNFYFRRHVLTGQAEQEQRWKRGVDVVDESVGELLGKLYVERYFPPEAKARMTHLVDNLKLAYAESIQSLDWMSPETKKAALVKLASFGTKIGYPDKWRDYSGLEIKADDLAGNIMASNAFDASFMLNKLGKPIDRDEWGMTPQTVNAYYNREMNEIVFPAAILQPPFFDLQADDAVNYGAIGAVIGHEIGHGFDDQGAKYDGEGKLHNWWQAEDLEKFQARTKTLIGQYNKYEPLPGQFVNGQFTLGENIGDLGGLSIALKAYHISLGGKKAPVVDRFTGDQRVFMGWAQVWRSKATDEMTTYLLKMDSHSPAIYRVNGVVRNIDAFYTAFDVKPGDAMYLPPEERVRIW